MMDSDSVDTHLKAYEIFLRECRLVEEERFPQHNAEIVLTVDRQQHSKFLERKHVHLTAESTSSGTEKASTTESTVPYIDLNWTVDLELLQVIDDGTLSENYHVPWENVQALSGALPAAQQPSTSSGQPARDTATSGKTQNKTDRMKAIRDGITRRISGLRSNEHARSVVNTVKNRKNPVPKYVLVAVIKWTGPSDGGFSVVSAVLKIDTFELSARGPISPQLVAENILVLDSSSTPEWRGYNQGSNRQHGMWDSDTWASQGLFRNHGQERVKARLELTLQLTENSIPRIGFPFAQLLVTDKEEFDRTITQLQTHIPTGGYVQVEGTDGNTYFLRRHDLTKCSAYFRAYLTDNWEHGREDGDRSVVQFPLVPIFTTCPDLIPLIVYFFERKTLTYGLSENAADLIAAGDVLGMPELVRLAEIATISNITQDNVTRLIRLAWQFQAGLLFRAALIFLRANYDDIWVKNRDDLAELGSRLSSDRFLRAFKDMSFALPGDNIVDI